MRCIAFFVAVPANPASSFFLTSYATVVAFTQNRCWLLSRNGTPRRIPIDCDSLSCRRGLFFFLRNFVSNQLPRLFIRSTWPPCCISPIFIFLSPALHLSSSFFTFRPFFLPAILLPSLLFLFKFLHPRTTTPASTFMADNRARISSAEELPDPIAFAQSFRNAAHHAERFQNLPNLNIGHTLERLTTAVTILTDQMTVVTDQVTTLETRIDNRFRALERRIDDRLEGMGNRFREFETRVDDRFVRLESRIDTMEKRTEVRLRIV